MEIKYAPFLLFVRIHIFQESLKFLQKKRVMFVSCLLKDTNEIDIFYLIGSQINFC